MSTGSRQGRPPTEEELRAAYEAEIKKIRVEQVLLENVVTLVNLGMRRTGLAPGTEAERDPGTGPARDRGDPRAAAAGRAVAPQQAGPIRDALSQLQLAFVRIGGRAGWPAPPRAGAASRAGPAPPCRAATTLRRAAASRRPAPPSEPRARAAKPGEPGPAQRSGRLWVPGSSTV